MPWTFCTGQVALASGEFPPQCQPAQAGGIVSKGDGMEEGDIGMSERFLAHDLLWLKADAAQRRPQWFGALPQWARERMLRCHPVVVRREAAPAGSVAVGVRGFARAERYGCFVPIGEVIRHVSLPELHDMPVRPGRLQLPALKAWEALRHRVVLAYPWGPSGSTAYELATQTDVVSCSSDLDLVVYVPYPLPRREGATLLAQLDHPDCHCDVQIEMPSGCAFALREWVRGDARILVKTPHGPVLSGKPWNVEANA